MRPLRTVVIGIEHGHARLYADAWSSTHDIVGFSTASREAAARFAARFPHAHATARWRDLLALCQPVELAYVLGRHCDMSEAAVAVASAGIPFVLEKPGGLDVDQVDAVRSAASATGTPATVPFVQRVGPLPDLLRMVGPIQHCSFQFITGRPRRYLESGNGWLLKKGEAGGGVLLNLGIHFIDLFHHLTGGPLSHVSGQVCTFDTSLEVEDHAVVVLTAASGARGVVEVSNTFPSADQRYVSFTAVGEDGALAVGTDGAVTLRLANGALVNSSVDVDSNHYYRRFTQLVHETYSAGFQGLPLIEDLRRGVEVVHDLYSTGRRPRSAEVPASTRSDLKDTRR